MRGGVPALIVYTALFGETDPLHEPACATTARFVCLTDQPGLLSERWEVFYLPPQTAPTRASRLVKALSHRQFAADWSLWLDASFTLLVDPYTLLHHGELVSFRHHVRNRIRDEGVAVVQAGMADAETIARQLSTYHAAGFDTDARPQQQLSAMGAILRRHTPAVMAFNEAWAAELRQYSPRDQLSADYVAWRQGLSIAHWPGTIPDNPYFRYHHTDCPVNDR